MEFYWKITDEDRDRITELLESSKNKVFVQDRINENVSLDNIPKFSTEEFWKWMIVCLVTTQQRSGPNSKTFKFMNKSPFPLNYEYCIQSQSLQNEAQVILAESGIRRNNKISEEIEWNLNFLKHENHWGHVSRIAEKLLEPRRREPKLEDIQLEREACLFAQNLKGIGPKQSRNLWQSLGLTRYEIPIDSRLIKWFNNNRFPFILSSTGMSDENYYQFVIGGIQKLCLEAGVCPCVLDAAIFSSSD